MKVVDKATDQPGQCTLTADFDGPFVDTEFWINCERVGINPHVYIHVPVAEQIGRTVGMVPESVLHSCEKELEDQRQRVIDLEAELNESSRVLDAVDTLKRNGYESKRRPGRPRKELIDGKAA
jgi:hypothetical protein